MTPDIWGAIMPTGAPTGQFEVLARVSEACV